VEFFCQSSATVPAPISQTTRAGGNLHRANRIVVAREAARPIPDIKGQNGLPARGQPMPGVAAVIARFERYRLPMAIASSSPPRLIGAVCDRFGLTGIQVRCSGLNEIQAKPVPDVYLTAARRLGVAPASCLALEDSPPGIAAAKAAGMRCVAVPDPLLAADPRYREADLVLSSLTELNDTALRRLGVPVPATRGAGQPERG
jgi:beta-phosphoglucomutase-like phosphatase (HAD superfamily)